MTHWLWCHRSMTMNYLSVFCHIRFGCILRKFCCLFTFLKQNDYQKIISIRKYSYGKSGHVWVITYLCFKGLLLLIHALGAGLAYPCELKEAQVSSQISMLSYAAAHRTDKNKWYIIKVFHEKLLLFSLQNLAHDTTVVQSLTQQCAFVTCA